MTDFSFEEIFQLGKDETPYRKLDGDFVHAKKVDGLEILKVAPDQASGDIQRPAGRVRHHQTHRLGGKILRKT